MGLRAAGGGWGRVQEPAVVRRPAVGNAKAVCEVGREHGSGMICRGW